MQDVEKAPEGTTVAAQEDQRQVPLKPEETRDKNSSPETTEGKPLVLPPDESFCTSQPDPDPGAPAPRPVLDDEGIKRTIEGITSIVYRTIRDTWKVKAGTPLERVKLYACIWRQLSERHVIHEHSPEYLASLLVDGCCEFFRGSPTISTPKAFQGNWARRIDPIETRLKGSVGVRAEMARGRAEELSIKRTFEDDEWRARMKAAAKRSLQAIKRGEVVSP